MPDINVDRRQSKRERRAEERIPFVAAVREEHAERVELALSLDLSAGGMRLRRPAAPPIAPRIRLEFELPDGPIAVEGELTFECKDGGFVASGVRFVSLGDEEALRIASYVADHAEEHPMQAAASA